eukprot:SAG31_NODE_8340_length_1471_cov_0.948251_1_plen_67_part_00
MLRSLQIKVKLEHALAEANRTLFQTSETPGYSKCVDASVVEARNNGFVGIVCEPDAEKRAEIASTK